MQPSRFLELGARRSHPIQQRMGSPLDIGMQSFAHAKLLHMPKLVQLPREGVDGRFRLDQILNWSWHQVPALADGRIDAQGSLRDALIPC